MQESNSALRAELGNCLKRLQHTLATLAGYIRSEARDAWLWCAPRREQHAFAEPHPDLSRAETLEGISDAILLIKYEHDYQDAHETRVFPGLVVVSKEGLTLADDVNRSKTALARVLRAMRDRTEIGVIDQRTGERGLRPLREVALEAFFFRRLNHWQATRRLEILRENPNYAGPPDYVGFMWATSRDVRRTSREELLQQAELPDARILNELDLATLSSLPAGEPLAIVRPGHTTPKANIHWPAEGGHAASSRVRLAVLPLIMCGDRLPSRLRKLPPAPTPKHFRLERVDTELEPQPLLQSLPVHRYLEHLRAQKRSLIGR